MQAVGSCSSLLAAASPALAAGCILFGLGVGKSHLVAAAQIAQREFKVSRMWVTVVALVIAINQAVFAFAPVIFGWLHDFTASYVAAFLVAAGAYGRCCSRSRFGASIPLSPVVAFGTNARTAVRPFGMPSG